MGNTHTSYKHPVLNFGTLSIGELQRIIILAIQKKTVNKLHVVQIYDIENGSTRYCTTLFIDIVEYVFSSFSLSGWMVPVDYFRLISLLLQHGANPNKRKIFLECKKNTDLTRHVLSNETVKFVSNSDILQNIKTKHLLLLAQILISHGFSTLDFFKLQQRYIFPDTPSYLIDPLDKGTDIRKHIAAFVIQREFRKRWKKIP